MALNPVTDQDVAAELVRRYNAHDELMGALKGALAKMLKDDEFIYGADMSTEITIARETLTKHAK